MTESGSFDLDPSSLKHVITIVSGNSVYIADQLLYDPLYDDSPRRISRVAGSLGRPGIVLLVPPQRPMVRPSNEGVWQSISHNAFDGKLENSFRETTLHLGFTDWKLPIDIGKHGLRDAEIYFLEALVSVHDHGEWVADLDILGCLRNRNLSRLRASLETCINDSSELHRQSGEAETSGFISIDNWEELLEPPLESGVVRASGNWQARLAAAVLAVQRGHRVCVLANTPCWKCCLHPRSAEEEEASDAEELDEGYEEEDEGDDSDVEASVEYETNSDYSPSYSEIEASKNRSEESERVDYLPIIYIA